MSQMYDMLKAAIGYSRLHNKHQESCNKVRPLAATTQTVTKAAVIILTALFVRVHSQIALDLHERNVLSQASYTDDFIECKDQFEAFSAHFLLGYPSCNVWHNL
eukprot:15285-Heterococcus_DN1.PRE.1